MVDYTYWRSTPVVAHGAAANEALVHMFMGVFFYDVLLSLPFDWQVLTGKRKLRWVHAAYFGTRLSMLSFCVGLLAFFWTQHAIDCQALFWVVETFMGLTVFTSSVLLSFRTVCVYHGREQVIVKVIVAVLAAALLAAWMQGVADVVVEWSTAEGHPPFADGFCNIISMKNDYWIKYVVTILFDAVILALTTIGVVRNAGTSRVGTVLIEQGIIYFIVTLLVNLLITTLTLMQLNIIMSLIAAMPQSVICVICSCRLYRNLADGTATRDHNTSMSGAGIMELDSNGEPLPISTDGKTPGSRGPLQRLFRNDSNFSATRSRGVMPSFVSGTTAYTRGEPKSPYERFPNTPGTASALNGASPSMGYFDIAPAPPQPQHRVITPGGRSEEVDFVAMMLEARRTSNTTPNAPAISMPSPSAAPVTFVTRKPSPRALAISVSVEDEQEE